MFPGSWPSTLYVMDARSVLDLHRFGGNRPPLQSTVRSRSIVGHEPCAGVRDASFVVFVRLLRVLRTASRSSGVDASCQAEEDRYRVGYRANSEETDRSEIPFEALYRGSSPTSHSSKRDSTSCTRQRQRRYCFHWRFFPCVPASLARTACRGAELSYFDRTLSPPRKKFSSRPVPPH